MYRQLLAVTLAVCSFATVAIVLPASLHAEPLRKGKPRLAAMPDPFVGGSSTAEAGFAGWGSSNIVAEARRWIGTNPTGRRSLWCARFMNFVLKRAGYRGTGSDMARSFSKYGRRISGPRVGAIAIMSRGGRGGHVGVVSRIDENGNPVIISGNHNNRVAEATYPRGRIYAYVMPGF